MGRESPPPGTVDQEMVALQEEFAQLLRERKQRIEDLLGAMGELEATKDAGDVESAQVARDAEGILKELATVVHKLSGSCAMYGYTSLGQIAGECQQRFLQEGQRLASDHETLNRILGVVLEALREGIETGPTPTL